MIFIGIGAWVFGSPDPKNITPQNSLSSSPTSGTTTQQTPSPSPSDFKTKTISIEAGSFYYSPKEIRVKKGETIRIVLKSIDTMHDFNIDEFNVDGPVTRSGESSTIEFTANKTGEFEYYCSVGQHRKMGQVGKLIVE